MRRARTAASSRAPSPFSVFIVVQPKAIPEREGRVTVPDFSPFAGVRYAGEPADLAALVAPPYDVIDDDQHAALEASHANNAVRLILPRDEQHDGDRYERAAATFTRWLAEGVLARDPAPYFYGYRMEFTDPSGVRRHTRGVLGALGLPASGDNSVLPHERTLPKAKSDRLALLEAMRVNVDPIWGLSLAPGLTSAIGDRPPLLACTDSDGVHHELFVIDDAAQIARISELVASAPVVLADGHHRFETALTYRKARPDDTGANAILTFVVELVDDELCIEPIHRLIDLPAGTDLRARLADAFDISDAGGVTPDNVDALVTRMRTEHGLGLVDGAGVALAVPRADARAAALADEHPAVAATDAAVVEAMVVPRLSDATWHYRDDAHTVASLVDKGSATAAILCSPVSVADTRAASEARVRMP